MSRRQRVLLLLAAGVVLAMAAVLLFGDDYRNEAREFLRNLIRAL